MKPAGQREPLAEPDAGAFPGKEEERHTHEHESRRCVQRGPTRVRDGRRLEGVAEQQRVDAQISTEDVLRQDDEPHRCRDGRQHLSRQSTGRVLPPGQEQQRCTGSDECEGHDRRHVGQPGNHAPRHGTPQDPAHHQHRRAQKRDASRARERNALQDPPAPGRSAHLGIRLPRRPGRRDRRHGSTGVGPPPTHSGSRPTSAPNAPATVAYTRAVMSTMNITFSSTPARAICGTVT
jgi:hypothetical protein